MFSNKFLAIIMKNVKFRSYSTSIPHVLNTSAVGENIEIKGWIKSMRKQKDNTFFDISDGLSSSKIQVIMSSNLLNSDITPGSSVSASGALSLSPKGQLELVASQIKLHGSCNVTEGYPFAPRKKYTQEYVRQYPHLRSRTNRFSALLRVRSAATLAIHSFFNKESFVNIHTPILTSNDCEGAGEVFKVVPESQGLLKSMERKDVSVDETFFDTKTFLTVSGQLHLEAMAHGLSKVYTFGPTFRAENSKSRLHLSEFYMVEGEIAFVEKLDELMCFLENFVKSISLSLVENQQDDMQICSEAESIDHNSWLNTKFPILEHDEAVQIILKNSSKFQEPFREEKGLTKEHELFLVQYCGNIPTFLVNFPKKSKPFYMKTCSENGEKVAALDLLVPNVGEMVGGSLRENSYDILKNNCPVGVDLEWYLDLRKFGSVPTAGFGLGFERYLQFLLGIGNIKDCIPYPRWPHHCSL